MLKLAVTCLQYQTTEDDISRGSTYFFKMKC